VVDEAAMADTRTLASILFQVDHAGGKAVLVGDPAQLPAVGPGGLFAAIVARNGAIELHDNHRQRDHLERRALALLREGRSRDYLAHAASRGRLTVAANRVEAKARLLADWWQAVRGDHPASAMIAYRRADVAELNAVARTLLDREACLGRERLRLASGIELAAGDRVLCTRNDRRVAVANGDRGTITVVHPDQRSVEVALDDERRLTLPEPYLAAGHVTHAYALTGHKTQGITLERAFVLSDDRRALSEWGYVSLSRAREQTRLYTSVSEFDPDAPPQRPEPAGPVDRLAEALTRPATETLALDAMTPRSDPTGRAGLAGQNRQLRERLLALEKERLDTTRQVHQTSRKLAGLGVVGRVRHGRVLRDQLGECQGRLAGLDRELVQVDKQLRVTRARALELAPIQPRPDRGLSRERGLERTPSGLERGVER
jgi:ATP-dependent exoDNAse (exonuclease V) alpha subunit